MNDNQNDPQKMTVMTVCLGVFAVIGAIVLLAACPLAVIWSLNGLFNLSIPYDFFHWSCAAVLLIMLRANVTSPSSSKNE